MHKAWGCRIRVWGYQLCCRTPGSSCVLVGTAPGWQSCTGDQRLAQEGSQPLGHGQFLNPSRDLWAAQDDGAHTSPWRGCELSSFPQLTTYTEIFLRSPPCAPTHPTTLSPVPEQWNPSVAAPSPRSPPDAGLRQRFHHFPAAVSLLLLLLRYRRPSSGSGYPSPRCGGKARRRCPHPRWRRGRGRSLSPSVPAEKMAAGHSGTPRPATTATPGPVAPAPPRPPLSRPAPALSPQRSPREGVRRRYPHAAPRGGRRAPLLLLPTP